ncbi:hypothetical protein PG987_016384 [Apiospora arundinis]
MPRYVKGAFESAIKLRQRCQKWFDVEGRSTQEAIDAHQHFIDVLKGCYSCFDEKDLFEKNHKNDHDESQLTFSNYFSMMEDHLVDTDGDSSEPDMPPTATTRNTTTRTTATRNTTTRTTATRNTTKRTTTTRTTSTPTTTPPTIQLYTTLASEYWTPDPQLEATLSIFSFFEDLHSMRSEMNKMWAEVALGQLQLPVASIATMQCLKTLNDIETKVCNQYCLAYYSTKCSYREMTDVLYSLKAPGSGRGPNYQHTAELSEADDFAFYNVGHVLTKLQQMKVLTKEAFWPPPMPKIGLYHLDDEEFLRPERYEKMVHDDRLITQVAMDIHLIELLELDGYAEPDATRLMRNPIQMAIRDIWTTDTVTVESAFAAVLLLDCETALASVPQQTPLASQAMVWDVKEQIRRDDSFYPFTVKESSREIYRERVWDEISLKLTVVMCVAEYATGTAAAANAYDGDESEPTAIILHNKEPTFLSRADPIMAGMLMLANNAESPLSPLITRLGSGKLDYAGLLQEITMLTFNRGSVDAAPKQQQSKKKKKKKKKGKARKKTKKGPRYQAPSTKLSLTESLSRLREGLVELLG